MIEDSELIEDANIVKRLDALAASITSVRVLGEVELSDEGERREAERVASSVDVEPVAGSLRLGASEGTDREARVARREIRKGTERINLNFADVGRALRNLADALTAKRVWLLLDEWSSVPTAVQPVLAEFLVRCVLPLQMFTVKIAAIEQQSTFRTSLPDGEVIGIEIGADVAANVDLDEFMVFEQNEEQSRAFFLGLLFKHLTLGVEDEDRID